MIRKLKAFMMLLLLNTLCGWSQQSQNWTVQKQNNDTVIIYTFTKNQLRDLHVYVETLEKIYKLYNIDQELLITKDSLLVNYRNQIDNQKAIIINKDSIITYQSSELTKLDKLYAEQEKLKNRYKSQSKYLFGGGTLIGFLLCLMLIR